MNTYRNSFPLAPLVDASAPGHRAPQRLSGTGTTESQTARRLVQGKVHVIFVGEEAVRVRFSANGAIGAGAVDPTRDVVYGPMSQIPFVPEETTLPDGTVYGSTFVYAEAADGSSVYEAVVIQFQS